MAVPDGIVRLVETFDQHRESYVKGRYNETQLRREFVDPFFVALGWDVDNKQGYATAYKDVIHEDAIRIGAATKAPDYCFRIGGTRKFFVEAKAPSVNLKDDPSPAYQLRRYAWSAKLPLSILTDFQEFAVYDCRVRPSQTDKASTARTIYMGYKEYLERWEEIASRFSREAVLKGSFDKYAQTEKRKHGTAEVDAAFLAEIEAWRDVLAHNIAIRNPALNNRQLNYAVQITIDRIIFLRICEDRGIERYGELQALFNGPDVYQRLMALFRKADDRYNSGLFHFRTEKDRPEGPDELTPELVIDDKVLKDILRSLYYPESPYEFSVLPAEILGQVYEQFLGKVITLTAGHHARVEDKPEVKKAGGVFYTPAYIVDYIVQQTVGKLLEGASVKLMKTKPPKLDRPLRVLDPACGSGSFLLGAYQCLLDWYRRYYTETTNPDEWAVTKHPPIYQAGIQGWKLTLSERKRILLDHIYGVDIDTQAVEVTKLSLLLRVLEGEKELRLFAMERALPDLASNIKCGNSLIAPDFYKNQQLDMFDEEERYRINAFDWHAEFPEIFKDNGFDAVIGNPPYVNAWGLFTSQPRVREYIASEKRYLTTDRHWDLYVAFMERGLGLLHTGGRLSFIIPFSYALQKYAIKSRQKFLTETVFESVADLRTVRVFGRVPVITIIPVAIKTRPEDNHMITVRRPSEGSSRYECAGITESHTVVQMDMLKQYESMLRLDLSPGVRAMVLRMDKRSTPLGRLCYINYGAQMSSKKKGGFGKDHVMRDCAENPGCRMMISGRDLYRYNIRWAGKYVDYSLADQMYGPRWPAFFESPKLMIRDITGTHRIEASFDDDGLYCDHTILCALRKCDVCDHQEYPKKDIEVSRQYDICYLAAIAASRALSAYCYFVLTGEGVRTGGGFHTYPHTIRRFPIPNIDIRDPAQKAQHNQAATLVEAMLELHKSLQAAKTPNERAALERQIAATDAQIDQLVYELYGLTDEEIRIVEAATRG